MAPALSSNSFLLTTTPGFRLSLKNRTGPRASSRLGKPKDEPEANQTGNSVKPNPFGFGFRKLPDVGSIIPIVTNTNSPGLAFGNSRRKDPGTVFVAGAMGQVGIRIAQTLLRNGFTVRAGVPDIDSAQSLARLAAAYKLISSEESKKLNAVESKFQDAESIAKAIGNAAKVVVTIGPGENGPDSQVSTSEALLVIQAAELAGVRHVAIIYDNNVNGARSTYNVLDGITLFFNNLFARSQPLTLPEFLQKVVETDVAYTLIKTSLAEDFSFEGSYNVKVSAEGSTGGPNAYKVAKIKIASLVADVFSNTAAAENKVVEVFADPSAPSRPVDELFSVIPEDGRRKAYAEALAKAKAEEVAEKARKAAEATQKLEDEVQKLSEQEAKAASLAGDVNEKADAAAITIDGLLTKAKDFGSVLSWEYFGSRVVSTAVKESTEIPKVQIATARGQTKARNLAPKTAVVKQANPNPFALKRKEAAKPKEKIDQEEKKEVRKVFGGLFKQETIYVDDD